MGLFVGSTPVTAVYVGSTPVTAVYVGAEKIWPTAEVHEVTLTNVHSGTYPLVVVTVPAGETWQVRIQGTALKPSNAMFNAPSFRIGTADSGKYGQGAAVDYSGTVTSADSTIAMVVTGGNDYFNASFTGTVTIEK